MNHCLFKAKDTKGAVGNTVDYSSLTLYLATFEATKKWTTTIRDWGQVYGELSIMYEGRLPE